MQEAYPSGSFLGNTNISHMFLSISYQGEMIGSLGVETAMKVIDGETVEKTIPVSLQLVVKE